MFRFFRRLRKRLFAEGRIARYSVYAIGEILLVVIGILIALQIDNWNDLRKERQLEHQLLLQLRSEYQSNLIQLDRKMAMRDGIITYSEKLLDLIDRQDAAPNDTVIWYLSNTRAAPTFDPITNDVIVTGKLRLIRSDTLRNLLSSWTSEVVQLTEEEKTWVDFRAKYYIPHQVEHGLHRSVADKKWGADGFKMAFIDSTSNFKVNIGPSHWDTDCFAAINTPQYESVLSGSVTINSLAQAQSLVLRERILDILRHIDAGIADQDS